MEIRDLEAQEIFLLLRNQVVNNEATVAITKPRAIASVMVGGSVALEQFFCSPCLAPV